MKVKVSLSGVCYHGDAESCHVVSPPTTDGVAPPPPPPNTEKSMMALKSAWPLVLFAVVSSTYVLALTKRHNVCDFCEDSELGRIRLRDPARNGSSGQIEICFGNYWQTVCGSGDPQQPHLFTDNDSTVACFQLGFTKGDPGARGSGCLPGHDQDTYLVVKPPCHGWEEKLFPLHLGSITGGGCTPRTAVSVTCEGEPARLIHKRSQDSGGGGGGGVLAPRKELWKLIGYLRLGKNLELIS